MLIGSLNGIDVFSSIQQDQKYYLLSKNVNDSVERIGFFHLNNYKPNNKTAYLQNTYVYDNVKGTGIYKMFFDILLYHEGFDEVLIGDMHTDSSKKAKKNMFHNTTRKFKMFWKNINTGQIEPYNPDIEKPYYNDDGDDSNGWQVLITK